MYPLASFVGSSTWLGVLITLHIFGAIVGLGPTFGFAIIGPAAEKQENPAAGLALLEVMEKIERAISTPILLTIQLGSGIALIFNRGLNEDFFSGHRAWLLAGIGIYVAAMILVLFVNVPAMSKAIKLGREGKGGSPEFLAATKIPKMLGPILTLMGVAIIVLMAWKPGSGCAYSC